MEELIIHVAYPATIVILGLNLSVMIGKYHKLENEVKELAEINRFLLNKVDRLERETILSHEALLRAKEQLLKQQQDERDSN